MSLLQRAALSAGALLMMTMSAGVAACELLLAEHRSGRPLARLALDPQRPTATVAFTHSVLGTPVSDRYEWRHEGPASRAHLVEERFEGDGYGLPNAAGPGQTLTRDGAGWRLQLDRVVDPLVLPPVQQMRVLIDGQQPLLLSSLTNKSVALRAEGCPSAH
ncbi:DUF1850 domain-containing protein [Piscinibacter sakaiensis]|uniref:DUF1850 domain-containing protein n=1 Tax=Piscinibacter sakaiensis TaxID=1547922 RepID=UPI003AB0C962